MNKRGLLFLIGLLLLGIFLFTFLIIKQKMLQTQDIIVSGLQMQEKEAQGVRVLVTPDVKDKEVVFDISMQTHTIELAEDLMQISELQDQDGGVYKPMAWEGAPAGGHHRAGLLKFTLDNRPKNITLTIRQFQGEDLVFNWSVNN